MRKVYWKVVYNDADGVFHQLYFHNHVAAFIAAEMHLTRPIKCNVTPKEYALITEWED